MGQFCGPALVAAIMPYRKPGERLYAFRERIGVSELTVCSWKNGHTSPNLAKIRDICSRLRLNANETAHIIQRANGPWTIRWSPFGITIKLIPHGNRWYMTPSMLAEVLGQSVQAISKRERLMSRDGEITVIQGPARQRLLDYAAVWRIVNSGISDRAAAFVAFAEDRRLARIMAGRRNAA